MSNAPNRAGARAEPWNERLLPWYAALISALLHLLMLLALLSASKPTMTTPQGAASGGRVKVDFIGQTRQPARPTPTPPGPPTPPKPKPVRTRPAASPVQSAVVVQADDPVPPPDPATPPDIPEPPRPPDDTAQSQAQAPPASQPEPTQRRETWTGRPPGMLEETTAPDDEGLARTTTATHGNRHDLDDAGPSLEVGGYLVYYDLRSETLLRTWMDQGMKEFFILLPGTRYRMACPLEIAMKRGSGKCRALAPDSPELKDIGDSREVITMLQVYRQGELVWRGPGPYR